MFVDRREGGGLMKLPPGAAYLMIATLCFVLMKLFVKRLEEIPISQIILCRSLFSLLFCYTALYVKGISPWGTHQKLLIGRGVCGACALWLYFWLIQRIPLASAYAIQYLAPIFTVLIAYFAFREQIRKSQWALYAAALCATLFIQKTDTRIQFHEWIVGLIATFLIGAAMNIIRALKGKEHPLVIIFYFPLITLPIITPYAIAQWVVPTPIQWMDLIAVGICTQAAQYLSTLAIFKAHSLTRIAIFGYLGIVYALIIGYFFNETYHWTTYIGMLVVTASVVASLYVKRDR